MRVGLVGFNCRTGLGEVNRQIVRYGNIDEWLVRNHKSKATLPLEMDRAYSTIGEDWYQVCQFVDRVDVILFVETPYYDGLVDYARARGKRIVCVPMQEWMPDDYNGWVAGVDLFICPTQHCYDQFKDELPCTLFPWPVDIERYPFRQRGRCEKFLFLNGNGGWKGRKGMSVISEALKLWPEMPLIIHSQTVKELDENKSLYDEGDVLLCPHHVDGLCLEIPEAMACGLPVISTKGLPWNEYAPLDTFEAKVERRKVNREVDWYLPDPRDIIEACKTILDFDLSGHSRQARSFVEKRDWNLKHEEFTDLVKFGKAAVTA